MPKKIIGIHGLSNKPPRETLEDWWKKSIREGLKINCGLQNPEFDFRMVYWADLLYKYQLHREAGFDFDPLFNQEPYIAAESGALKEYKDSWKDELKADVKGIAGSTTDFMRRRFNIDGLTDWLLEKGARDLAYYYDVTQEIMNHSGQKEPVQKVLRDELKHTLLEEQGNDILLIAHSMGSIIAYDVLRALGQTNPELQIPHLVTIGSPLGLPLVKAKIMEQCAYDPEVRTPSIVTESWKNFADKKDKVAYDVHLRDDYQTNRTDIRVIDDLVANDYQGPDGKREHNHHKSYGYLRTPEFSKHIKASLGL